MHKWHPPPAANVGVEDIIEWKVMRVNHKRGHACSDSWQYTRLLTFFMTIFSYINTIENDHLERSCKMHASHAYISKARNTLRHLYHLPKEAVRND